MANARTHASVSLERLQQVLPAAYGNYQHLVLALELMIQYRIETLSLLNGVADDLDRRHRQGNIAKIASSTVGLAGSTVAAVGLAMTPFTAGASALLVGAGGAVCAIVGGSASLGAHIAEKVCERVDLEKVQQAVDRDKQQCERVKELWQEFDSYCVDVINTIALADPSRESDVASFQTWVQVALENTVHPVVLIAETFHNEFSKATKPLSTPDGKVLMKCVGKMAQRMIGDPVTLLCSIVSKFFKNFLAISGTVAFLVIAAIGVGNLLVLITTSIDIYSGSLSKVAKVLREKSDKLHKELDTWLGTFGK